MKIKKHRHGLHLDMSGLKREGEALQPEYKAISDRASEFIQDKEALEDIIRKIQISEIPDVDKIKIIIILTSDLDRLEKQYDRDVSQKQNELNERLQLIIEFIQAEAEEFERKRDELISISLNHADISFAAEEADSQKRELNEMEQQEIERLQLQTEQQEQQRRYIQRRNVSRR